MMVYQEKPPHPLPVPTREPPDVLLCQRTIQSLEQENAWLKEQLARIALNMPVAAKDCQILQGEPKGWRRKSPTGADVTSWFCGDCGGRIYGERAGRLQCRTGESSAWVLAMKGPDAPWLASFVSQPTNEELCAKVGDGMRG